MMTSSNGNIFRVTGPFCVEFTGEFPSQRPYTRKFDNFFDLRLNKWLRKQSRRRWFETQLRSLWRHCNAEGPDDYIGQHCCRHWLGAEQATSHYLHQCWPSYQTLYGVTMISYLSNLTDVMKHMPHGQTLLLKSYSQLQPRWFMLTTNGCLD